MGHRCLHRTSGHGAPTLDSGRLPIVPKLLREPVLDVVSCSDRNETRFGKTRGLRAPAAINVSQMVENEVMFRPILWLLLFSCPSAPFSAQVFQGVLSDYVPEGKQKRQSGISTVEQCQTACTANEGCKAYAFRMSKPVCYFYSRVFMGGSPRSREMGLYSSGLSIIPKRGFVSAFKTSSFSPPPVYVRGPD
jgi:hypothetical protein